MKIKSRTYYFYNDLINIKDFDARLLKLDKNINGSKFITLFMSQKKPDWNVNSVNPRYLMINRTDGFIEETEGNKYLNMAITDRNSKVLKKYTEV